MKQNPGMVDAEGRSSVPEDIYDMAELGRKLVDPDLDESITRTLRELDSSFDEMKARYKLEVAFSARSIHKPFSGLVTAWTNGGFANGGGDESVYFCPAKLDAKNGGYRRCRAPISYALISRNIAVCERCKSSHHPKKLAGQVFAKLTNQYWAVLLTTLFRDLSCNADIRIGTMPGDLQQATLIEQERDKGGELMDGVRHKRRWVIYPLKNIIKDTSNGAELQGRIRAFLQS